MDNKRVIILGFMFFIFLAVWNGLAGIVDATNSPILHRFSTISTVALTLPSNRDANLRVARVKHSAGNLKEGHILVTNFNKGNMRDHASAIVDVAPDGAFSVFSRITPDSIPGSCPGGIGAATGLVVLRAGWVIVGIMPQQDDGAATSDRGCLIVLDSSGKPVETFSGSLVSGPGDMIAYETDYEAKLFVTNALTRGVAADGQIVNEGSVLRINLDIPPNSIPRIASMTVVASGFPEITRPDAPVSGPTGLGLSPGCGNGDDDNCRAGAERSELLLYVADSSSNRIAVIENALSRTTSAGVGSTLSAGGSLDEPRGLVVAPNGHLLTANRTDGTITEITPQGQQIAKAAGGQYWLTAWSRSTVTEPDYSELAAVR